jgi:hypothetical protein
MRKPASNWVKTFWLTWAAAWGIAWALMTIAAFTQHAQAGPATDPWFRTGALLFAWAGMFAWKGLQPPPGA